MKNTGFTEGIGTKDILHIKDEVASRKQLINDSLKKV